MYIIDPDVYYISRCIKYIFGCIKYIFGCIKYISGCIIHIHKCTHPSFHAEVLPKQPPINQMAFRHDQKHGTYCLCMHVSCVCFSCVLAYVRSVCDAEFKQTQCFVHSVPILVQGCMCCIAFVCMCASISVIFDACTNKLRCSQVKSNDVWLALTSD